jgi:hypothetical protein
MDKVGSLTQGKDLNRSLTEAFSYDSKSDYFGVC